MSRTEIKIIVEKETMEQRIVTRTVSPDTCTADEFRRRLRMMLREKGTRREDNESILTDFFLHLHHLAFSSNYKIKERCMAAECPWKLRA